MELGIDSRINSANVVEAAHRDLAVVMLENAPGNSVSHSNIHIRCTPIVVQISPSGAAS